MFDDSNDDTNFSHKLKLLQMVYQLIQTQLSKMVRLGGFLIPFFGPILSAVVKGGAEVIKRGGPILAKNGTKYFVNKGIYTLNENYTYTIS